MQHCCVQIEWSFGDKGEEGHRLRHPIRIAANTLGEFLVVDMDDKTVKVFDSSEKFIYKINPQVDHHWRIDDVYDVATDVNNNTYILVCLSEYIPGTQRREVQVFTKTEMRNVFPVRDYSKRLTVSHDRVFLASSEVIDVYELSGIPVGRFGNRKLSGYIKDIAAGSDGQIFVLNFKRNPDEKIAYVFTEDSHQQYEFRVDSKEDDYIRLASYPSGEHIVFSGVERKTRTLKVAMYRKDGVFNRSVTLGQRLSKYGEWWILDVSGIAVTNNGSVAISFCGQEDQRKVIVRPMKPC